MGDEADTRPGALRHSPVVRDRSPVVLAVLAAVTLLNYAAQIPYYFILYFPAPPSLPGAVLLAITFVWFVVGFVRYRRGRPLGAVVLGTFLATEVLFYGALVVLAVMTGGRGGAGAQLSASDPRLWAIFAIGYANGLVCAVALVALIVRRRDEPGALTGRSR